MIDFRKEDFVIDIVEASRPQKGKPLMDSHERDIDVYHLDGIKIWWCNKYRNGNKLRSCDAYYEDSDNRLVIEFKNTNHLLMKPYMDEIKEKFVDSHMLLAETFFRNRKMKDIAGKLNMVLVYNDTLKLYPGVQNIGNALNCMKPMTGDQPRNSQCRASYQTEEEYMEAVTLIKDSFQGDFYNSVDFIDKKDFYEMYINVGYFKQLPRS